MDNHKAYSFLQELKNLQDKYKVKLVLGIDQGRFDGLYLRDKHDMHYYLTTKCKDQYTHKIDFKAEFDLLEERITDQQETFFAKLQQETLAKSLQEFLADEDEREALAEQEAEEEFNLFLSQENCEDEGFYFGALYYSCIHEALHEECTCKKEINKPATLRLYDDTTGEEYISEIVLIKYNETSMYYPSEAVLKQFEETQEEYTNKLKQILTTEEYNRLFPSNK